MRGVEFIGWGAFLLVSNIAEILYHCAFEKISTHIQHVHYSNTKKCIIFLCLYMPIVLILFFILSLSNLKLAFIIGLLGLVICVLAAILSTYFFNKRNNT